MYVGYVAMGMWMSQYQEAQYSRVQKVGREPIWGKCGSVPYGTSVFSVGTGRRCAWGMGGQSS